jgi:hypothetical protein
MKLRLEIGAYDRSLLLSGTYFDFKVFQKNWNSVLKARVSVPGFIFSRLNLTTRTNKNPTTQRESTNSLILGVIILNPIFRHSIKSETLTNRFQL